MAQSKSTKLDRVKASLSRQRVERKEVVQRGLGLIVGAGTGALIGFAQAKAKQAGNVNFYIPKTEIPYDLAAGLVVGGLGLFGIGGRQLSPFLVDAGSAALAVATARAIEAKTLEPDAP